MKKNKISFILFILLAPVLVIYYLVIKIKELIGTDKCCEGCGDNCCSDEGEVVTPRQDRIIEYIRKNRRATVPELLKLFPNVTDRTLRRDLNKMEESGLVLRSGSTKSVSYTVK